VFWAQRQPQKLKKSVVASIMFVGAAITLLGVVGASMMMWFPRISETLG
jgi:hypothetical protein